MRRKTEEDIMKTKSSVAYDENEKLCRGYNEYESSVETIMRMKTVEAMM
jgi:hypothetical protein